MIFYFSGTGNALWVAKELSKVFNERLISIADELKRPDGLLEYTLQGKENIYFVFPVHSWGPAVLAYRFIEKLSFSNYTDRSVYLVCVCGDNCGNTDKITKKLLAQKSIHLTKSYSIQMPNNYILMKGFGIDPKAIKEEKLTKAPELIDKIVRDIQEKKNENLYVAGNFPFVKSRIIYPLFKKFAIKNNSFFAKDNCISCGLCVDICPTNTIKFVDEKPVWGNNCVQCTACIHRCPIQAIEFGKITSNQGRYVHPDLV